MDEQDWLTSDNLFYMTEYLSLVNVPRTKNGRRKLRLYSCACARSVWEHLHPTGRSLIEVVELCLDDRIGESAVEQEVRAVLAYLTWDPDSHRSYHTAESIALAAAEKHDPLGMARNSAMAVPVVLANAIRKMRLEAGETTEQASLAITESQVRIRRWQADLLREIFGNPFRPMPKRKWSADLRGLAQACHEDASNYPMLADALTDAGEEEAALHCRQTGHVKGCHVVDWILGKS